MTAEGCRADCNPPFTDDEEAGYAHRSARCADPLGYNPPYALPPIPSPREGPERRAD
jgi:hypothetical protein